MFEEICAQVESISQPFLEQFTVDLVELKIKSDRRQFMVDILADKPEGGITIDICADLNRCIADELEVQNIFDKPFVVNVCSPGADRPLKSAKDFRRVIGREIRFYLKEKVLNKLEHMGRVTDVSELDIQIQSKSESISIPIEKINKAVQVI